MKFKIIGSGGCVCTPKPICQCPVCVEARAKGFPYARCGCSLFLKDVHLLVDTPEDIAVALNNADIKQVDAVMYSHWDPDHTMGMRIFEQLRLEWLDVFDGNTCNNPVMVYATAKTMSDINAIKNKFGSFLDYYENSAKLIKRNIVSAPLMMGDVKITFVPVTTNDGVSVFVFESEGKKLIYAPCDCTPFPENEIFNDADVLILGDVSFVGAAKNGKNIPDDYHKEMQLHSFEEALLLKTHFNIKKLIITHLEELYGKSHDDYMALQKSYDDVFFAYDGMEILL